MFGLSAFLSTSKSRYGAVFDVASDSVGVALVKAEQGARLPCVLFSHRVNMRIGSTSPDPGERLKQMRETLFSASLIFSKDGLQALAEHDKRARIEKIFLVCSSPWAYTISRDVTYEDDANFQITEDLVADLAQSAERGLDEPTSDEAIIMSNGYDVVERATVNIRVNGYTVQNPVLLNGKNLSLSHITGFMLRDIVEAVTEVRDKILTDTDIEAHTGMLVAYCVFRDFFPETTELTIVSVTGESTEVGIIERGVLLETHSIQYGVNSLVREIIEKTDQTGEHILTMLRGYAEHSLSESARNTIETHANLYAMKLSELFSTILGRRNLPKTLIILCEPEVESFIKNAVKENLENTMNEQISILNAGENLREELCGDKYTDMRLALQSRFFHKLHGCNEPNED